MITRARWIVALQAFWVVMAAVLVLWWGKVLTDQAARIQEYQIRSGVSGSDAHLGLERVRRMIHWELGSQILILFAISGGVFWMHARDLRRSRQIRSFFAATTHELRTPLTSVRLQAESLAEAIPPGSPSMPLVERLLEDASRLESQINRALELARLEGGGGVSLESLDLKLWVERLASREPARFKTSIESLAVRADSSALSVVMRNLLENSVRHSGREEGLEIAIEAKRRGDKAVLLYRDNGRGLSISPKEAGTLFLKGPSSHGSGVGLYLARELMRKMGGEARFGMASGAGFQAELFFDLVQSEEGEA